MDNVDRREKLFSHSAKLVWQWKRHGDVDWRMVRELVEEHEGLWHGFAAAHGCITEHVWVPSLVYEE
jgi:hypothetical protein